MRKSLLVMSLSAVLCGMSLGSAYGQYANEIEAMRQENARLRLAFSETEKGFQEQYQKVVAHVNSLQDIMVQMQATVAECKKRTADDGAKPQNPAEIAALRQQIQAVQAENTALRQEVASALNKLRQMIDAESRQRQAGMQKLVDVVAGSGAATQSTPRTAPVQPTVAAGADTAGGDSGGGTEFYEYTVQKGATLGVIAKAYKVSIEDIRKANKLSKADMLRVGQKLLIPKK